MSAVVVSLDAFRRDHGMTQQLRASLVVEAHRKVLALLKGRVRGDLIAEAQRDAADLVREEVDPVRAAACAVARALARHNDNPTPPEVA